MVMVAERLALGAPGILVRPDERIRALTGVPMDVAAFAGIAPRGPSRVPRPNPKDPDRPWRPDPGGRRSRTVATPVESWDEYQRLFGSFEGGGFLPYAVATFFEQGGRRAYVLRIVHDYGDARDLQGVASGSFTTIEADDRSPVTLRARDEGAWGDDLRVRLTYTTRPLPCVEASTTGLVVATSTPLPSGTLLRLVMPGGTLWTTFADPIRDVDPPDGSARVRHATFTRQPPLDPVAVDIVEGVLEVEDADPRLRRAERHEGLGFSPDHPRWLAAVLAAESSLVWAAGDWIDRRLAVPAALPGETIGRFAGGDDDRASDITPDDFFDRAWVPGDDGPGDGVQALGETVDVSLLVTPDLYLPWPLPPVDDVTDPPTLAGPRFAWCVDLLPPRQERRPVELLGLRLDPAMPADLRRIIALQRSLVEFAERQRGPAVLLDVPPGLSTSRLRRWREEFDTSYAACYHPWLRVSRADDSRDAAIAIPPSAVATGIVARRERLFGVPWGPANELAEGVIDVVERVPAAVHDELHPEGINVFLIERDGVRLTAARTLSRDGAWRQLSVRRLMTMLGRIIEQQLQWMVFEPNDHALRASIRHMLRAFLGQLYRGRALAGATEAEAFFVRCDEANNPQRVVDAGQLIVEVGVAPAEPLEFLVLRFSRDGDGILLAETRRG
jgi:uncharacterized protein